MSRWEDFEVERKITDILSAVPDYAPDHHFSRPFLTAYQLAIEYMRLHSADVAQWGLPIGGIGTGQRNSLSQYLAQRLSARIKDGQITHIEGSFLSNQHLDSVTFEHNDQIIRSSLTNTPFTLSMFRLRDI